MTRSTGPGAPYTPGPTCSPTPRPGVSRPCSLMIATPWSRPPGASTSASSRPTAPTDPGLGKYLMQRLIDSLRQAVPDGLEEIQTLARTLISRSQNVLAYFDRPRTSNDPTPSHQRTPGAPTRHRPGICATSPTTPSAASSTPDASKTTWQQPPKPVDKPHLQHPQTRRAGLAWEPSAHQLRPELQVAGPGNGGGQY